MSKRLKPALLTLACFLVSFLLFANSNAFAQKFEFPYQKLNVSYAKANLKPNQHPIIIAVVDDGFSSKHPLFEGMLWNNPKEIASNATDDDDNGYIDDVLGWDISDMDENITPPQSRLKEFYHGTQSAGVIAQIIRKKLGQLEDYPIKLMFVKAISDGASKLYVKDGYSGIQYAAENGADIVSNSWSGGELSRENAQILNHARNEKIFIVNSVGNFYTKEPAYPALHPAVFAVAGINQQNQLIVQSNYGEMVDISAPAENIPSANLESSNGWHIQTGTSLAVPMVAATAALMLLKNREITPAQIQSCLKNSAFPIEQDNPKYTGRLGAGALNIDGAIDCAIHPTQNSSELIKVPEGTIYFDSQDVNAITKQNAYQWTISPQGEYDGLSLNSFVSNDAGMTTINVRPANNAQSLWTGLLKDFPQKIHFGQSRIIITITADESANFSWQSEFKVKPIIFSDRFCDGLQEIVASSIIHDGSGNKNYEASSSCQWQIKATDKQMIKIQFTQFDLEKDHDLIHFFRGSTTRQEDFLYTATGQELPPTLIIKGGPVLLWFLSDMQNQGQGFSAKIEIIADPEFSQ